MNETTLYWIWLQQAVGYGSSAAARLLQQFPDAKAVYQADRSLLSRAHIPESMMDRLCNKSLKNAERCYRDSLSLGWVLTYDDPSYPELLKEIYSPPLVLYGKGLLPDMNHTPVISFVGTRKSTAYGERVASSLAAGLAAGGFVVVSGGATGIDCAAHTGALSNGRTIAIQACGLDIEYPRVTRLMREHILKTGGAIISEYPPGIPAYASNFTARNRIISGIALGVCIVEAPQPSGALMTARHAREQNRDIFVVPGEITSPQSEGSHALIKEGAQLVSHAGEVVAEYCYRFGDRLDVSAANEAQKQYDNTMHHFCTEPEPVCHVADTPLQIAGLSPCPTTVSDTTRAVYEALTEQPCPAESISETLRLPLGEVLASLTELEVYGCVCRHAGQLYSR